MPRPAASLARLPVGRSLPATVVGRSPDLQQQQDPPAAAGHVPDALHPCDRRPPPELAHKAMALPSYISQPAVLVVQFRAKEFDEVLELHLPWDPGGRSSEQHGLNMASARGQEAFQGGGDVMALAAHYLDHTYCVDEDCTDHDHYPTTASTMATMESRSFKHHGILVG